MNLFRGSWNITEDETPIHSPVRLLQKLAAYRASSTTSPSSSTSPVNERKPTILSESTNFFTRLWRPNALTTHHQPSPTLIASHEAASSSFDHIPEPVPAHASTSSGLLPSPRSPNRRMSFIREVSPKSPSLLFPFPPPPPSPPLLQPQPTTSSTATDPSFEDTTSEHPCDSASEIYSQSFETNIDSSNPGIDDEQQGLTYDERHRRLSQSAKPVIPLVQQIPSYAIRIIGQHHSDSLASPEANIDVSMVSSLL
jgi:hypothetical protein